MGHAPSRHRVDDADYDGAAAAVQRPKPGASRTQTVFQVRRTRDFSSIPNDIITHPRLMLDERMALIWMLSRPADWQFHPGHMRAEWGVGRVVYYRIIKSLQREGYVKRGDMVRSEDQRYWVAISYRVSDVAEEPDAPIEGEDEGRAVAGAAPDVPPPARPCVGFVHADDVHAGDQPGEQIIDITNNPPTPQEPKPPPKQDHEPGDQADDPLREADPPVAGDGSGPPIKDRGGRDGDPAPPPPADAPSYEEFIAGYPPELEGSRAAAVRVWLRLPPAKRAAAKDRLPAFLGARRAKNWKIPLAVNYLRDEQWTSADAPAPKPQVFTISHTATGQDGVRWAKWRDYWRDTRGPFSVRWMYQRSKRHGAVVVPSPWPPSGPPVPEPLEEARAAAMLINHPEADAVTLARGTEGFTEWLRLAKFFNVPVGVRKVTDTSKPPTAPDREIEVGRFPAAMPPTLPKGG